MQAIGSSQVSPQSAPSHFVGAPAPTAGAEAVVCFAGVAQLVEHLFCKQVVRGSSPRASSGPLHGPQLSESCPSGQREQAVNLPAYAYAGSNPALSTRSRSFRGPNPETGRTARRSFAGVAQLVERQPSKLNVEGSNPFSRSARRVLASEPAVLDLSSGAQLPPAEVNSAGPPLRFWGPDPKTAAAVSVATIKAHLAQMVEHVLGKDEVTSSILVVGSKQQK